MAGLAGGRPVVAYAEDVTVPEAAAEAPGCRRSWSPLRRSARRTRCSAPPTASGSSRAADERPRGDPPERALVLRLPGAARDGRERPGRAASHLQLMKGSQRLGRPLDLPLSAVQVSTDVFVYANSINLAALPETGEYTPRVRGLRSVRRAEGDPRGAAQRHRVTQVGRPIQGRRSKNEDQPPTHRTPPGGLGSSCSILQSLVVRCRCVRRDPERRRTQCSSRARIPGHRRGVGHRSGGHPSLGRMTNWRTR